MLSWLASCGQYQLRGQVSGSLSSPSLATALLYQLPYLPHFISLTRPPPPPKETLTLLTPNLAHMGV